MCKNGKRCQICIGCGRCYGEGQDGLKGIRFVMHNSLSDGFSDEICAYDGERRLVTVDIGTTTIAMQLYERDGAVADCFAVVNPQVEYGADVLSRIAAATDSAVAQKLQLQVRNVLQQGFQQFQKSLAAGESMLTVIAANTTMSYFLMGYDTAELGRAPFVASHLEMADFELAGVRCVVVPGLSAFVGGDIVAGMFACDMWRRDEVTLLIDLGTNGELVLGNREKMIACATAAGPAFEGGVNRGIWGADMVRLLAKLLQDGIMDETGLLSDAYFDKGVRIGDVCVTQGSIRAVQLAKGAIRAGIEILLQEYGINHQEIHRVVLAGGFGYYLLPEAAAAIGLLPHELAGKAVAGGNTALSGVLQLGSCLLQGQEDSMQIARERVQILNLATVPEFEQLYLEYMNFV